MIYNELMRSGLWVNGEAVVTADYSPVSLKDLAFPVPFGLPPSTRFLGQPDVLSPQSVGLIHWLPFSEPGGSFAYDLVSGSTATVNGPDPDLNYVVDGGRNGYVYSTYEDDYETTGYLSLPADPRLQNPAQLTVSLWFRLVFFGLDTDRGLFEKIGDSDLTRSLGIKWVSGQGVTVLTGTGESSASTGTTGFALNTWYHVVVCYDSTGSANTDKLKLYVNGLAVTLTFAEDVASSIGLTSAGSIWLGRVDDTYGSTYLDDLRVYNRTLTPAEVYGIFAPQTRWSLSRRPALFAPATVPAATGLYVGGEAIVGSDDQNVVLPYGVLVAGLSDVSTATAVDPHGVWLSGEVSEQGVYSVSVQLSGVVLAGGADVSQIQQTDVQGWGVWVAGEAFVESGILIEPAGVWASGSAVPGGSQTYVPSGAALVSGTIVGRLIPSAVAEACTCTIYNEVTSGGAYVSGGYSPQVYSNVASGGTVGGGFGLVVADQFTGVGSLASGSADVDVPTQVWDSFEAVWLLQEEGAGIAGEYVERSHGYSGQGGSGHVPSITSGPGCNYAQHDDGTQWIELQKDNLSSTQSFAVSAWIQLDAIDGFYRSFYSRGWDSGDSSWVFSFGVNHLGMLFAELNYNDGSYHWVQGSEILNVGRWTHVAVNVDVAAGVFTTYVDGEQDAVSAETWPSREAVSLTNSCFVGKSNGKQIWRGSLADLRLHAVIRSADWFRAERLNYCAGLVVVGGEESA